MTTFAIKQGRPHRGDDTFNVVLRRHDLSGTDYEPMVHVDRTLAIALGTNGVVVRSRDVAIARGRPGIVVDAIEMDDGYVAEIRADVVDPTTVMDTFHVGIGIPSEVMGDQGVVQLQWVGVPPSV